MKEKVLHNNISASATGEILTLVGTREGDLFVPIAVLIVVSKCSRTSLLPSVSLDNSTWQPLKVQSVATGNVYDRITSPGSYIAKVGGWKYFKAPATVQSGGSVTVTALATVEMPDVSVSTITNRKIKRPSTLNPTVTKANSGQAYFVPGATDNVIYAISAGLVKKSTDGITFSTLATFTNKVVQRVALLSDTTLLVFLNDGTIHKSTIGDETAFTLVHTMETPGAAASNSFGFSQFNNIVLIAEYGTAIPPNNACKLYISKDYGATWTTAFAGPTDSGTWHCHDVKFDPYEQIIWLVNGDGAINANVRWSKDFGTNWNTVYADGECPTQFTQIIPLPNCVLFGTDNKNWGVWRWDRGNGIKSLNKVSIEEALTLDDNYTGSEPMATDAGVVYGDSAVAYFGFSFFADQIYNHAQVWATTDGYTFYPMWASATPPLSSSGGCGIMAVSAPSTDGKVLVTYRSVEGDPSSFYLVKITAPTWT